MQARGRVCPSPAGKPVFPCPGRVAAEGHLSRHRRHQNDGEDTEEEVEVSAASFPALLSLPPASELAWRWGTSPAARQLLSTPQRAPAGVKTSVPRRAVGRSLVQGYTPFPAWPTSNDEVTKPPSQTGQLRGHPGLRAQLPPHPISFPSSVPGCGAGTTPCKCTLVCSSELASWGPKSQHWCLFHCPENNSTHFQNFVQNS